MSPAEESAIRDMRDKVVEQTTVINQLVTQVERLVEALQGDGSTNMPGLEKRVDRLEIEAKERRIAKNANCTGVWSAVASIIGFLGTVGAVVVAWLLNQGTK